MFTLDTIKNAIKRTDEARKAESDYREERAKQGLPSWDLFISDALWLYYRDEGIKAGRIIKAKDHYVVSVPGYPPARVVLFKNAGEEMTIPKPPEDK